MTDVVIIGAGHNGLVCATELARAGRRVLVLEAAPQVGGAAVTREFAPGFRVSSVAHLLYGLDPELAQSLGLAGHGLELAAPALRSVALAEQGSPLILDGATVVSGELSATDRAALATFWPRLLRFADVLGRQHGRPPPRLAWSGLADAWPAARLALDLRRLGRDDMREFLRIAGINIHDVLEEQFASPQLKGLFALDAVLGTRAGPRSGNTALALLHRLSAQAGNLALPRGGMGAVTQALAAAARAAGAEIRTGARVTAIRLQGDRVAGVRTAAGEDIAAAVVISNADPKTTLLKLLGGRHLEAGFARRIENLRATGTAAKLHLALRGLPAFRGLPPAHVGDRLVIAPTADYVERAFNPAKYRQYSPAPVMEITVPTVTDPSLAPQGQHVLSAVVQYAPADLEGGWDAARGAFQELLLTTLERYAPGIRGQVSAVELLTPADLTGQFGLHGGHWHHAELALDQLLMLRPVPGAAQYAMPVQGLYLCGAGTHPGGGVMGHAGRNAARAVLAARAEAAA
jgi:phytoene dehydrogenase-like protein